MTLATATQPRRRPRTLVEDPLIFAKAIWPTVRFYNRQREIIYSVADNDETYCPAANEMGKDFVAAFIAIWWFCSRRPARVVTTSVQGSQLEDVLWGEIRRFIQTARVKLPIQYNHLKIRQLREDGAFEPQSELVGQVCKAKEGLLGRHATEGFEPLAQYDIPRTLVIFDEASAIDDETYNSTQTWAHRKLIIGNCWECSNFFSRNADENAKDIPRDPQDLSKGYYRKIIRIPASDSPNVRYAEKEIELGIPPSGRVLIPGVKTYKDYVRQRKPAAEGGWDEMLQCVGLDAKFYKGKEVRLFPQLWLSRAKQLGLELHRAGKGIGRRIARGIGIDPGEGSANTSLSAADEYGIIETESHKTPDTSDIVDITLAFCRRHGVREENMECVVFDRGGGGYQIANQMRRSGFMVRTVAFGESVQMEQRRGFQQYRPYKERLELAESRYAYVNRRAQMYGELSRLLDPHDGIVVDGVGQIGGERGYGISPWGEACKELMRQLSLMPKQRDKEGRMKLPSKNKTATKSTEKSLTEIIGCSPDEADSVVLAIHAMLHPPHKSKAGVG